MRQTRTFGLIGTIVLSGALAGPAAAASPFTAPETKLGDFCEPSELFADDVTEPGPLSRTTDVELCGLFDQADPFWERSRLLGDLGGVRPVLTDHGLSFNSYLTQFSQGIADGGLAGSTAYGGKLDSYFAVDGKQAGLWEGFFINMHAETRFGTSVNSSTGTLLPVNTAMLFPVPGREITALTQVKFTQALSENFAVFAGKLNLLDEYVLPFGGGKGTTSFQNMAFVFNPIFARTLPYSTLGGGAAYLKDGVPVASILVVDALNNPTQSGFDTLFAQGAVISADLRLPVTIFGRPGHQGFTGVWSSRNYGSLDSSSYVILPPTPIIIPGEESGSWCLAYRFDQALYVDPCNPQRSWGLFGQFGISDGNPCPIRWFSSVGLGGNSPLRCRTNDTFGLGYFYTGVSDTLITSLAPIVPLRNEQGIELFYNVAVTKWCQITPDLQVIDPARLAADTVVVLGGRVQISF